jgi:hypothetical protein
MLRICVFLRHVVRPLVFAYALFAGLGCPSSTSNSVNQNPVSTASSGSGATCGFTEVDQFSVNVNPTQDFSVSNVQDIPAIENSTCSGLPNLIQPAETFSSGTSSDGHIDFSGASGSDDIFISGNQATTPASELVACENGTLATGTLQKVELDSVADQVRVTISWTLIKNGCTQAPSVTGMGAPANVVTDTYSVSSTISSSPFYFYVESDPGTTTGSFNQWSYTNANASFSAGGYLVQGFQIGASSNDGTSSWSVSLNVPGPDQVAPGSYSVSVPTSTNSPSVLLTGYDKTLGGYLSYQVTGGSFQILSVTYDSFGALLKLVATFSVTVDGYNATTIRGSISYDVTQGFLSPVAPTDVTSPYLLNLQGNLGTGVTTPVSFNQTTGTFSATGQYIAGGTVNVGYTDTSGTNWQLGFKFPSGVLPAPGAYGFPSGSSQPSAVNQQATLSINNCGALNVGSSFNVLDAQYDSNGVLVSFAANFSQNCGPNQPIAGTVRYNQPQTTPVPYTGPSDQTSLDLLYMVSSPGDPMGKGQTLSYTDAQGSFGVGGQNSHINVDFWGSSGGPDWGVAFTAPGSGPLSPGTYVTTETPGAAGNAPSLSIYGPFACTVSLGQFQIVKISYDSNGNLLTLEANFSQNCNWNAAPLQGTVRFGTLP